MLELFEDDDAGAFTDDEPVAFLVERTARAAGIVVARRKRAHRAESADTHRGDCRFGTAGNHGDRVAPADDLERLADRMSRRRAGRAGGQVRPFRAEPDRHLAWQKK